MKFSMTTDRPPDVLLTVAICTHNRAAYLELALQSLATPFLLGHFPPCQILARGAVAAA